MYYLIVLQYTQKHLRKRHDNEKELPGVRFKLAFLEFYFSCDTPGQNVTKITIDSIFNDGKSEN